MSYQINVSFVGETSIVFSETWVNCKVLSISTVILPYYMVSCELAIQCQFVLVKHILFFQRLGILQSIVNFDCDFILLHVEL